jgi:hypothetical protein
VYDFRYMSNNPTLQSLLKHAPVTTAKKATHHLSNKKPHECGA